MYLSQKEINKNHFLSKQKCGPAKINFAHFHHLETKNNVEKKYIYSTNYLRDSEKVKQDDDGSMNRRYLYAHMENGTDTVLPEYAASYLPFRVPFG